MYSKLNCTTCPSSKPSLDTRVRDRFINTNLDLFLIAVLLALYHVGCAYANEETTAHEETTTVTETTPDEVTTEHGSASEEEILIEQEYSVYAVLYPWFVEIIGVFAYYFLSRYLHALPYTAVMFIVGFFIGFAVQRTEVNGITISAANWINIEGEVILLVFLPGLLYLDSYNIDIHLFLQSFWQLIAFAFPMVLGGTALTACVAYYLFPYGWSLDLSMTFGAILSATDPVAVAVLLNELGAPPRLKMHISGESLLNDGSAVVFYHIFSSRFFYEMGLPGIGEEIGWGKGFLLFFRLSLGGMCIGIIFGIGAVIVLYNLNRRLSGEDSVVQVVLTITAAYLCFFVSEILAGCSGIIAVMFCGLVVKGLGETMINNTELMHHFWEITEYLLNTLLFTLGGTVWGDIIANNRAIEGFTGVFNAVDWGYLILLYVMLHLIRFALLAAFYPLISKIGIGTNPKEAGFMGWAGLRGAVGIALALSLNSEVIHYTSSEELDEATREQYRHYTEKLFGMVGGIAFLTLVINGTSSGPLLRWLGLVTPSETRKKVIENYRQHMITHTIKEYVQLLSDERFKDVDYTVIKAHVSYLNNITFEQLMAAVQKHKDETPTHEYNQPNLKHVVPYLYKEHQPNGGISTLEPTGEKHATFAGDVKVMRRKRQTSIQAMRRDRSQKSTVFDLTSKVDEREVYEERLIFLKLLRSAYYSQIEHGELESRGFIAHSLFHSLDVEEDRAVRGLSMNDWEALQVVSSSLARPAEYARKRAFEIKDRLLGGKAMPWGMEFFLVSMQVRQALAFTQAHKRAAKIFRQEFTCTSKQSLSSAEKIVLDESAAQVRLADKAIQGLDKEDVKMIKSHYACHILLSRSAHYFSKLSQYGLMSQREAGEFIEEIEEEIHSLIACKEFAHEDEITTETKMHRLSRIPEYMLANMDLKEETENYRLSLEKVGDAGGFFSTHP
ncbi:hypothetical protein ACHAWO_007524 [Cyclotella atomus]|uniref:Cation/H+ exchanger transmembrane domain-containing protein n=1 Tax=Cyclotella atomus TaxID=382360 RepID=A0ABD3MZK2_9STRA